MSATVNLVPKPTAAEEVRASVMALLRDVLEQAEAGEIECVMMVTVGPGGYWKPLMSKTDNFSGMMGRLEIAQQEWILDYMTQQANSK
jgi:hypothetical protein